MIVVMQCAGKKQPGAGHMRTADGRKVLFAHPDRAPAGDSVYAHPDDGAGAGETWRSKLLRYNETPAKVCLPIFPPLFRVCSRFLFLNIGTSV
jgi:hypothetical protein